MLSKYELVEIENVEEENFNGVVYDVEVEEDHSYNVEGIAVHNSACLTRVKAGVGMPQLSAAAECADAAHGLKGLVCSDGGCTCPGDVAKAIGAGSDFVMLGGMLAGTDECEGEWEYDMCDEPVALEFYGMSSKEAQEKHNGGLKDYRASEGKCVRVKYKGNVDGVVQDVLGGLRSACTYVGAEKLKHLSKCCTFIRVNRTHNQIFG